MTPLEVTEMIHYVATTLSVVGAAGLFVLNSRRQRQYDAEAANEKLRAEYALLLKVMVANPDIQVGPYVQRTTGSAEPDPRAVIVYEMFIALVSRAFWFSQTFAPPGRRESLWSPWAGLLLDWTKDTRFLVLAPDLIADEAEPFRLAAHEVLEQVRQDMVFARSS